MQHTRVWLVRNGAAAVMAAALFTLTGCATVPATVTLIDGERGLENFTQVGEADWRAADGAIQATRGGKEASFLVSRDSYRDFTLRAEFWASDDANSGVFTRCMEPARPTDENCYEANIFDQRTDQSYATGAIVKVAKVAQPAPRAGGKWNTFEITMKGNRLTVVLNGQTTVNVEDGRFTRGPVALQWARGTIRFRKLEIQPL